VARVDLPCHSSSRRPMTTHGPHGLRGGSWRLAPVTHVGTGWLSVLPAIEHTPRASSKITSAVLHRDGHGKRGDNRRSGNADRTPRAERRNGAAPAVALGYLRKLLALQVKTARNEGAPSPR
jgi:hypothetical protein